MIHRLGDRWGHGSQFVAIGGVTFRITNRRRRWIAAVRCDCGNRAHWHDVMTARTQGSLRVALVATTAFFGSEATP